jgi:hypothetical protein
MHFETFSTLLLMRKIIFIVLAFLFCFGQAAFSQTTGAPSASTYKKNVITFHPIGVVNKVRLKYEYAVAPNISIGAIGSAYYGIYPGIQVSPFLRYYFDAEAPHGLYLQGSVPISVHNLTYGEGYDYLAYDPFSGAFYVASSYKPREENFATAGLGLGLGYQIMTGKRKGIVIDIMIGAKFMIDAPEPVYPDFDGYNYTSVDTWNATGPGSLFNGMLGVGFAF